MLQINRTCVPNRAVARGRETMTEDVGVDVELGVGQHAVVVGALALVAAIVPAEVDHTRGRVILLVVQAVTIIALTHHVCRLLLTTRMEFIFVHRLFDAMVRHRGARIGEHRPRWTLQ